MKTAVLSAVLLASSLAPRIVSAAPRKLTFATAIDLTLANSRDLALASETKAAARTRLSGAKARRLPSLRANAAANLYREPYQLPFGTEVFTLHKRFTTFSTLTVTQPLTGLAYLSELVGAADHDAKAASADYDRARLDASYATAEAYLRVLEARSAEDVSRHTVTDIAAELDRAQKLRAADTLTNVDVLRLQSAKAGADQAAVRASTNAQIAEAQLVLAIGLPDGEAIELADDLPPAPPPLALTIDQAVARAIQARPELRAARERTAAASDLITSRKLEYLPDVRAVGVYQHTSGVEPFQPANEEYVGLTLNWNLWDWGATRDNVTEAEHTRTSARLTSEALGDKVRLDVRRRWLEAKASLDNLANAQIQLQTAEEAYRLQHVKFENGVATTTDVLDAETDVARARLQAALARYDYYLGLVGLSRAIGDVPAVGGTK